MAVARRLRLLVALAVALIIDLPAALDAFKLPGSGRPVLRVARSVRAFAKPETLERICSIVAHKFEKEESAIEPDCNYVSEFGADNLDEVELLLSIEEEFDLTIPDYEFNELRTVKDIADYVDRQLARKEDA